MVNDGAASLFAVALRVARLTETGAPAVGAGNLYVTDSLVRVSFNTDFREGETIERTNGKGETCISFKQADTLRGLAMGLEICSPDPELWELLSGGTVLMDGADVIGYAYPETGTDPNPNGVSLEVWTRAIVGDQPAASQPYMRWVFPRVKLRTGERAAAAEAMENAFEGTAEQNAAWGNGPANDWDHVSGRVAAFVRTATAPPAPAVGAQETVADVP